ncbi:MAG: ABC transporter ATP-binding protein [Oscillospiraceae bacterium]|nr:ABC transporter ATP-binding protein [Oscillospiraceae bacterium]
MLQFENVTVTAGKKELLKAVSFAVRPHRITALIGRNGSGKSTLLSCVNQSRKYTGSVYFGDRDIRLMSARERGKLISFLPQILPSPSITVEELVKLGRCPYQDIGKRMTDSDRGHVDEAMESMGIKEIRNKYLGEISGGERQKAYIAMVLAQNTRVVLFDEPTTYLDISFEKEFLSLLQTLKSKHKKTVLTVMHDLTGAFEAADDIAVLENGRLVFSGEKQMCVESGVIEEVFGVKKYEYLDGEKKKILFK